MGPSGAIGKDLLRAGPFSVLLLGFCPVTSPASHGEAGRRAASFCEAL